MIFLSQLVRTFRTSYGATVRSVRSGVYTPMAINIYTGEYSARKAWTGINILVTCKRLELTRQLLGYFATHHLLGEGALNAPARRARRQTKACDKTLQMSTYNFNFKVTSQVQIRSDIKLDLQQDALRDFGLAPFVLKTARIVQNPSLECYMSAMFKQWLIKYRSGSRLGHKDKVILPIVKVCLLT